jgi:copper transport protein
LVRVIRTLTARCSALAGALALVLAVVRIATAHATLIGSEPPAGSRISSSPERIRLLFSEPVEPNLTKISLIAADGKLLAVSTSGDPHDVHAVIARVEIPLGPGEYRVAWHIVSADGHPVGGSFLFGVATNVDTTHAITTHADTLHLTEPPPVSDTHIWGPSVAGAPIVPALLRGAGVGCLIALTGLLWFIVPTGASDARPLRVALWLSVATPVLLVGHLLSWLANTSPDQTLSATWMATALGTTLGTIELVRTGASLLPLWALGLARRPTLALATSVVALLASSAVGHSAAIQPSWAIPSKALHLVALALWLGGLLWIVTRDRDRSDDASRITHVSRLILWAVVVIAATGLVQTILVVPAFGDLWSPYGGVAIAKIVGLIVLVGFGAYHRGLVTRIIARDERAVQSLATSVSREVVVFCAVLILAGFLAYLSPPRAAQASHSSASELR